MTERVKYIPEDELKERLKKFSEQEEKLKNLLITGKQKEQEIENKLKTLKNIIEKKMNESKKTNRKKIFDILGSKKEKAVAMTKSIKNSIQETLDKREKKILEKKKRQLEQEIDRAQNIVNMISLQTDFPKQQLQQINNRIETANTSLNDIKTTKEDINYNKQKMKDIHTIIKKHNQLKEQKKEQEKRIKIKKEKLKTLIYTTREILNQALLDSAFSESGKLSKLEHEAQTIIEKRSPNEQEIENITDRLFKEAKKIAKMLDLGTISKTGKLIKKKLVHKTKETATKHVQHLEEIKKLEETAEKLKHMLEMVHNDNEKIANELKIIEEQKKHVLGETEKKHK